MANTMGAVIQKNHYYPFGMAFAESSTAEQGKQPYKYNNKELDQMHGLNMYDYSARFMDGVRFTTVDPLAEKYYSISPYAYVENNPLKYIDPTGREKLIYHWIFTLNSLQAAQYPDDGAIHIFTHSRPDRMLLENFKDSKSGKGTYGSIKDAKGLYNLLESDSETWKNKKVNEVQTIVLHGCNLAEIGPDGISLAQRISADPRFENQLIIAPTKKFTMATDEKGNLVKTGVYGVKYQNGKRTANYNNMGHWAIYFNGQEIDRLDGDQMPTKKEDSRLSSFLMNLWNSIEGDFTINF